MVNEAGHFPEVCKKSVQAQAGDMAGVFSSDDAARYSIAHLATFSSRQLERLGRFTIPLIARDGDTHYHPIGWDEALDITANGLRNASPRRAFFYASGRSSNEAAFLLQVVARAWGTSNINNCSCYCHNASGAALSRVYGSGTASVVLDDLARSDFALIAGANPASNHPRLITQLVRLRRRGGRVVVINPLRELGLERFRVPSDMRSMLFGSTVSDLYLQPHIGSDLALFQALLKGVIESGGVDESFVRDYTDGWDAVRDTTEQADWDTLTRVCGVPRDTIAETVRMVLAAKRGIFCWAMGLTQHAHGVDTILALSNLVLALGWLGKPGCGLLPIRGHSNVQGVGSVGVTPSLKAAFAEKLEALYGVSATPSRAEAKGWDTYESMCAAKSGTAHAAVLLGGNLYGSNPDQSWAGQALRNLPLTAFVSTKWNTGHIHGRGHTSLILPALARDEEPQSTTQESMFNLVRLSDAGTPAVQGEMRSEVEIIASLAERLLPPDD